MNFVEALDRELGRLAYAGDLDVPPSSRCAACGLCCRHMPGLFIPKDLEPDFDEKVERLLRTGDYAIDWWEGDVISGGDVSRICFLRPATKRGRADGLIFDASWGGECVLLGPDGCTLPRDHRPTVCKSLVPNAGGPCREVMTKEHVAALWRGDYSDRLERIGQRIGRESGNWYDGDQGELLA